MDKKRVDPISRHIFITQIIFMNYNQHIRGIDFDQRIQTNNNTTLEQVFQKKVTI